MRQLSLLILLAFMCAAAAHSADTYKAVFSARLEPTEGLAIVSLTIEQSSHKLRELDFAAPKERFTEFNGDGKVRRSGDRLQWQVPKKGGTLHYKVTIDNPRGKAYDARITSRWAILRLDDVFPAARARSAPGAESRSFLELSGPSGWTFESRYGPVRERVAADTAGRRFSRPTGWLAAGELGVRRDLFEGRTLTVAGPSGQGLRRLDTLAFLRWNLPELLQVFPEFPDYFLVVRAQEDMWRGGLSGPNSLYLHSERPLISENATSTLLHELVHLATGEQAKERDDWVVEGLAEYYSLQILLRSGGISEERYSGAMTKLQAWADRDSGTLRSPSTGPHTARAATILQALQQELQQSGVASLDLLVTQLLAAGKLTGKQLKLEAERQLGHPSKVLREAEQRYVQSK